MAGYPKGSAFHKFKFYSPLRNSGSQKIPVHGLTCDDVGISVLLLVFILETDVMGWLWRSRRDNLEGELKMKWDVLKRSCAAAVAPSLLNRL